MRTAFMDTLFDVASRDPRVMMLVGDLGFGVVDRFARELPNQFLNVGVAEQNLIGVAAGLALSGKVVFAYSIANFPLLRCLEQIRNDVCYHRANVKIVAVGGGLAYGSLGMSHHATEDLAVARSLPNLLVVAPNDPAEAEAATRAVAAWDGPCYFRLGRAGEARIAQSGTFTLGRAISVREGRDLAIVVGAGMLGTVLKVTEALASRGLQARVLSVHTIKPLDEEAIAAAASTTPALFTVEEHSRIGGLGSAVCEVLMERGIHPPVMKRIGLDDGFVSIGGTQDYLRAQQGLDVAGILRTVETALRQSPPATPVER
jgi:transketolase